jgi:hypothetical protein
MGIQSLVLRPRKSGKRLKQQIISLNERKVNRPQQGGASRKEIVTRATELPAALASKGERSVLFSF